MSTLDRVKFLATSSGTGAFVPASAVTGFLTPAGAGVADGTIVTYVAQNPSNVAEWEYGCSTSASSGTSIARRPLRSSLGVGATCNFSNPPQVAFGILSEQVAGSISVEMFGAVGDGSTDDTTAINNTIAFASAGGIGLVTFSRGATYKILGEIIGKPGVSLDGQGCTILYGGTFYAFIFASTNVAGPSTRLTADVATGDNVLQVSTTTGFSVGGLVWYGLDEDPGDNTESTYFGFARVTAVVTNTSITLDTRLPRPTSGVTSWSLPTNQYNKIVWSLSNPITDIYVKNFKIGVFSGGGPTYPALYCLWCQDVFFENISCKNFPALVQGLYCDNIVVRNSNHIINTTVASFNRAITFSESTNILVENLTTCGYTTVMAVFYAEFSTRIRGINIKHQNNYASSSGGMFFSYSSGSSALSAIEVDGLHITGKGGWSLTTGSGDLTFRDVTLDIDAATATIPIRFLRGLFRQNIAGAGWTVANYDEPQIEHNTTTTGAQTVYVNLNPETQFMTTTLTGDVTITLDTTVARIGDKFRVVSPASLGGHTLNVVGAATTSMAASTWLEEQYDGSGWLVISKGSV